MNDRLSLVLSCLLLSPLMAQELRIDFEESETGREPEGFLVLAGLFTVQEEGDKRHLHLPGAPLEDFGALFGEPTGSGVRVDASFRSRSRGRLHPSYGLGVHGLGGWRLMMSGSRGQLELRREGRTLVAAPHRFPSGRWTRLALEARPLDRGRWRVRGKAWDPDEPEPGDWTLEHITTIEASRGRPSLWGLPFSGHPIHFDDLVAEPIPIP